MNHQKLDLHFAQVERAFSNSSSNVYSDANKKNFQDQLRFIFDCYKGIKQVKTLDINQIQIFRTVLNIIIDHLDHLDASIIGKFPTELIFCLDVVLEEWIDDYDKYLVLTSLSNKNNKYQIVHYPLVTYEYLNGEVSNLSGTSFKFAHTPILLQIPRFQSHCFLANAVVYHEIGHFIDFKYKIIDTLFDQDKFLAGLTEKAKTKSYYREFFCDLFAAQYVGKASNNYLNYINYKDDDGDSHPSTDSRLKVVDDFLSGKSNEYIDRIIPAVEKLTNRKMESKLIELPLDFFSNGNSIKIENKTQLSSLFPLAWDTWIDQDSTFMKKHGNDLLTAHNNLNKLMINSIRSILN